MEEFTLFNGTYHISGIRYVPEKPNGTPVVMSHGFLSNQKRLKDYANYLCNLGYTVYTYDFCGGHIMGKSEGPRSYLTLKHELLDMETVISYVKEDKHNLILFGESQGGFLSLIYASENVGKVSRVLCIYPALSIPDDARKGKMLFLRFRPEDVDGTFHSALGFSFSKDYAKEALELSLEDIINNVACPCCIVSGDRDKIVSPSYPLKVREMLSDDSEVILIPGAGHGFNHGEVLKACQYFSEFLSRNENL